MSSVEPNASNPSGWRARLIEPSAHISDRSERRTARLLSTILLLLLPLALLSAALQMAADGAVGGLQIALAGAAVAIAIAYALSRSRYFRIAGAITTMVPTAAGLTVLAIDTADPGWFAFMALNPALGWLFMPMAWSVVLAAFNLVAVIAATAVAGGLDSDVAIVAIMFNGIVSVVLVTAAIFRDRLEHDRRAELIARQGLQSSILEGTFSGVAIVRDDKISEANEAFAELVDAEPDQLVGASLHALVGIAADGRAEELDASNGRTIELTILRPDGSSFDAEMIARSTPDPHAKVVAIRDITERKRNDLALERAQRMESVGRVAAGLAHDTNNELLIISAHADRVRSDLSQAGLSTETVGQIRDATDRIATLIGRVLLFGRDDASAPAPIDLGLAIERNGSMWRQVLGSQVDLRLAPTDGCIVVIDRARLDQLLLNLVLNARDAIDGVGEIHIGSRTVTIDRPIAPGHDDLAPGRYHQVTVTDNGPGVEEDHRSRVFDPFFTTKDHDHGTGLGLYTSREIARKAGGDLILECEPGRTTFTLTLPEHVAGDERP